ncbi:cytidine deaminase [Trichoderma reesei RUT C-30]|uniref:Cytidine deaminase n=1 Tax=Hypocrea jecorina (strain ATCC 56765 / BCRC 32924 / NRRL 11460 / Rut C-30) TaxID=1344414 RepID=A0A024SLE1_HYPJR|nr:cytidine deaminase [Trichoderma reesei RUT C-30]
MSTPPILSGADEAQIASTCAAIGISVSEFSELRRRATAAKATAYCRYSRFRVGATLLCTAPENDAAAAAAGEGGQDDDEVVVGLVRGPGRTVYVPGANVENASYPVGTCAERVALGTAVTSGIRTFRAIAVATDISPPASPCGMCRQFIREFCTMKTPIIMFDKNSDYVVMTVDQLLPMSFGPDALPPPGAPGVH